MHFIFSIATLGIFLLSTETSPLSGQTFRLLDIMSVSSEGEPSQWVHEFEIPLNPAEFQCDILIAGAGMGGMAAALKAAQYGLKVCLTEETDWIGGQATSGGVSALDENRFIEFSGGTRTYNEFRRRIRDHYRTTHTLAPTVRELENLNPGRCYVSSLCAEPKVALKVLEAMLAPHKEQILLFLRTQIFKLEIDGNLIVSALAYRFEEGEVVRLIPRFVLDATELGDLLPLAGVPYKVGAEGAGETQEPSAPELPNPACVQSFTYSFVVEHRPSEMHRILEPPDYHKWRKSDKYTLRLNYPVELGWRGWIQYSMFGEDPPIPNNQTPRPFFPWRRLVAAENFVGANAPKDLALINWPSQGYTEESIIDRDPIDKARILQSAKRLSLGFLYWLQNEVPRDDGRGFGYPELRLRPDVMGSADGLSKYPYIRESRRIRAIGTVKEQDIVARFQPGPRARWFDDSVGTGFYMVDIHPCGAGETVRNAMPRPFQLPLGTLIPEKVSNLLASAKNIGVTRITNGAFRLHPVEWNVGEAAATFASLSLRDGKRPATFEVQRELIRAGVQLVWFDDLEVGHPSFEAIQLAALKRIYPKSAHDLHAAPGAPVTRGEAAHALVTYFGAIVGQVRSSTIDVPADHPHARAIDFALEKGWMGVDHRNWFHPDLPFYWTDWREARFPRQITQIVTTRTGPVTRAELAERLTASIR